MDGLDRDRVAGWLATDFADVLVNRRSTTWRQLPETERQASGEELVQLLLDHPTLIKRPVFESDGILAVGFKPDALQELLEP